MTDDKAGVVCGFEAVEVLCEEAGFDDFAAITLVCSPDEEIGSPFSRPLIEALAGEHDVAVGLEAARTNGALVSARKGISAFTIEVTGKAVHAGVRPTEGSTRCWRRPTRRSPCSPERPLARGDLQRRGAAGRQPHQRGRRPGEPAGGGQGGHDAAFDQAMDEVERIVAATTVQGAGAELLPAHRHPPMERTEAVAALVGEAQAVARDLGFEVGEAATGEAGDANTTAAVGLPTIDGLAPVGGEAHGPTEWLDLDSVVPAPPCWPGCWPGWGPGESPASHLYLQHPWPGPERGWSRRSGASSSSCWSPSW